MSLDFAPQPPATGRGDTPGDESPPETFAQFIARQAAERLTELDAQADSVAGQIEALRLELDKIQRDKAEAIRIQRAALGTDELELARKVSETPSAADEAVPAEAEAEIGSEPPPDWTGGTWPPAPEAEQVAERVEDRPEWTGGKWSDDERVAALLDEAARDWLATQRPSASFTVADLKAALDVTRPVASGVVDRLQQAGVITEIDGGRAFVQAVEQEDQPDEIRPVEAAALDVAGVEVGDEIDNEVAVEPESRPKPTHGTVRANNQVVTLEMVRDGIREHFGVGVKFNIRELGDKMGQVPATVRKYVAELHTNGTLKRSGGARGPGVKYEMVKPDPRSGPREHPRHDGPRQLPKGAAANGQQRGVAVAHTGRPVGRSGRPGADRKKAQLGFRVKDRKKK